MRTLCTGLLVFILASCAPSAGAAATASPAGAGATPPVMPSAAPTATAAASAAGSPSPTSIALPAAAQVAAAGNGVVWTLVADARLFLSKDRGTTWEERTPPPPLVNGNIAFVDDANGWALSAGSPATGCMAEGYQVFRTTDGARTWRPLFRDSFLTSAGCKSGIAFSDTLHGYIAVSSRDGGSWILRTSDGGSSWSESSKVTGPLPTDPTRSPSYVNAPGAVADFGTVLFISTTTQLGPQVPRAIFRSTDRGATWTFAGTPPSTDVGITFLTPSRWLALLLSAPSAETTDGGVMWHPFASDYQQAAPVAPQIVFGDPSTGYATVRGSIQRTIDGGAHWTHISTPGT